MLSFFYGIKTSTSLSINVFILTLRRMYQRVINLVSTIQHT